MGTFARLTLHSGDGAVRKIHPLVSISGYHGIDFGPNGMLLSY